MSDSDSVYSFYESWEHGYQRHFTYGGDVPGVEPSNAIYSWDKIPVHIKQTASQLMKVCSFWLPMVLQRQRVNSITQWAMHVGFIDSKDSELDLNHLYKIEILEAVLRALDHGCWTLDQTRYLIWICNTFNLQAPEALDDALEWLKLSGEPNICHQVQELGSRYVCYAVLQHVFADYAKFIQAMGINCDGIMKALKVSPNEKDLLKSEEMKTKGNEYFQIKDYDSAIKCYTRAIRCTPDNRNLYGNRALCYIRCEKYLKAVWDGKRATLIDPLWAKGHYRFCEALFYLKEHTKAIEANVFAQRLCSRDGDVTEMKELVNQHKRFTSETTGKDRQTWEGQSKRPDITSRQTPAAPQPPIVESHPHSQDFKEVQAKVKKKVADWVNSAHAGKEIMTPIVTLVLDKGAFSEPAKGKSEDPKVSTIKKPKTVNDHSHEKTPLPVCNPSHKTPLKNTKTVDTKSVCAAMQSAVQDGHQALADQRSRLAEKAFSQALSLLKTNTLKDLGLTTLDEALLRYGRALALTEMGQPEELMQALREFDDIKSFQRRTFECLVYYGVGRVFIKENRFKDALGCFLDSQQMVHKQITPGKLTWPLTKEIVKETQLDYFKDQLMKEIELCKFPPIPDAICRHEKCRMKTEIYFTDPDFKGFIRILCCHKCIVEFHISCWKTIKATSFSDSNEKDCLQLACFTPDCRGRICNIQIYGSTGLIKCKFETAIIKPDHPKKLRVNQKCTSPKKIQSKEERRRHRKQQKKASREKQTAVSQDISAEVNALAPAEDEDEAGSCTPSLYRDRILFQISQNREFLREHRCHNVTALATSLRPWVELDLSKGNQVAAKFLELDHMQLQTLGQMVDLLLERRNRVWARVFIEFLSSSLTWAQQLDNEGLNAARVFIECHSKYLEDMDLASLFNFAPLQDVLIKKFDTRPELLSQAGIAVTEYLKQAPAQDVRVFIWTLEEHRDQYDHCHTMLNEFFEILDGNCLVMKKSENEYQSNSPLKNRNRSRKKKTKENKSFFGVSMIRGGPQRDERDFSDDHDDLSFHGGDPFSVPDHLREEVACFEYYYNPVNHKSILDNNPDSTEESLYDYFSQILEEHGPLGAQDPLLLGQLDSFPAEAQQKIQKAGGFKPFLLQSLRFVMIGEHIGLAKHAVSLQEAVGGTTDQDAPSTDFLPYYPDFNSQQTSSRSTSSVCSLNECVTPVSWATASEIAESPKYVRHSSPVDLGDVDLYSSEVDDDAKSKELPKAEAHRPEVRSVAVNTDNKSDINEKEKHNRDLEEMILNTKKDSDERNLQYKRAIISLEKEVEETNVNIQVTKKEVELFQQKLKDMLSSDQKEKKANQDQLTALKIQTEELAVTRASLSKSLQETSKKYDAQLKDFIVLSNQSAASKMNLEEEIQRCNDLCAKAAARSRAAELLTLENTRKQGLYCLHKSLADTREILFKLEEAGHRYSPQVMAPLRSSWAACVQEAAEKISATEVLYEDQVEQLKSGQRLSGLPSVPVPCAPEPPVTLPWAGHIDKPTTRDAAATSQADGKSQPCGASSALAAAEAEGPQAPPVTSSHGGRRLDTQQSTKFDKILEHLATMFPDYTRPELMKFVQKSRRATGGSLTSFQDVITRVTQIILDHQVRMEHQEAVGPPGGRARQSGPPSARASPAPHPAPHAWLPVGQHKPSHVKALNTEDPCIICHDDMTPESVCVLECRHSFHQECIKSWLKEQNTCPTCREHALLPEDFPLLAGRKRHRPPPPSCS